MFVNPTLTIMNRTRVRMTLYITFHIHRSCGVATVQVVVGAIL